MEKHLDFHVVEGDFNLDSSGFAEIISDRYTIGQDVKHRLIESGLLMQLVGERDPLKISSLKNKILIEVEKDERLDPGTAKLSETEKAGVYYLHANTLQYGELSISL